MKNLSQVREDINRIDNVLHAQMDARMQCSDAVARAKLQTKDPVYKPKREQEILTRFEDDCYYQRFMRKVMQLSRHDQYGMFLKESETEPEFLSQTHFLTGDGHACDICVKLQADATCENAMNQTQMLSVISDWFADIRSLKEELRNLEDEAEKAAKFKECRYCNAKNPQSAAYCAKCGEKL